MPARQSRLTSGGGRLRQIGHSGESVAAPLSEPVATSGTPRLVQAVWAPKLRAAFGRGEEVPAHRTLPLHHAGQGLPWSGIGHPRVRSPSCLLVGTAVPRRVLFMSAFPSFRLLVSPQAVAAFSAMSCLSRLATASRSISAVVWCSIPPTVLVLKI